MAEETNPSKKLITIIQLVVDMGISRNNDGDNMANVWGRAHGVAPQNIYESVDEAMQLADVCDRFMRQNNVKDPEIHLQSITSIKRALYSLHAMNWAQFKQQFNHERIMLLQLMDSEFSEHWHETPLADNDLEWLQSEVEDLIHDVVESQLSTDIKNVILDGLEAVRYAILEYRVRGMEGIRQALDKNVASLIRYRDEFDEMKRGDHEGIWTRWSSVVGRLDGWVSTGLKLKQHVQPAISMLMPGEAG
jgi:hypothetical protein